MFNFGFVFFVIFGVEFGFGMAGVDIVDVVFFIVGFFKVGE